MRLPSLFHHEESINKLVTTESVCDNHTVAATVTALALFFIAAYYLHYHPIIVSTLRNNMTKNTAPLPPATLIYHESARSIVFRDQIRRTVKHHTNGKTSSISDSRSNNNHHFTTSSSNITDDGHSVASHESDHTNNSGTTNASSSVGVPSVIDGIQPLEQLELRSDDVFTALVDSCVSGKSQEDNNNDSIASTVLTEWEQEVVQRLQDQTCVMKTIRNSEWTTFLPKLSASWQDNDSSLNEKKKEKAKGKGKERGSQTSGGFSSSTSLLPSGGTKMRCFGSAREFTVGCLFYLPDENDDNIDNDDGVDDNESHVMDIASVEALNETKTWCWPSGYSAKTEFNIDSRGNLINGRYEALVSIIELRRVNHIYQHDTDYMLAGRMIKGGLVTVPYNEMLVRVGGVGYDNDGTTSTGKQQRDKRKRSYQRGIGPPMALFVRTATYGNLVSLLRIKSRLIKAFQSTTTSNHLNHLPLFLITPGEGIRVLTSQLQTQLFRNLASRVNPFQNPHLINITTVDKSTPAGLEQKLEELLDLDQLGLGEGEGSDDAKSSNQNRLTPEECARLAGGFGATDESVAKLLMGALQEDTKNSKSTKRNSNLRNMHCAPSIPEATEEEEAENDDENEHDSNSCNFNNNQSNNGHRLQDIVNEGLVSAVRSGDYHTSKQLLVLYTLVASRGSRQQHQQLQLKGDDQNKLVSLENGSSTSCGSKENGEELDRQLHDQQQQKLKNTNVAMLMESSSSKSNDILSDPSMMIPPPPPPPLDTDRLRSATNSDGLLAVLGAAQVLKSMQDGSAKTRTGEAAVAIEELSRFSSRVVPQRTSCLSFLTITIHVCASVCYFAC